MKKKKRLYIKFVKELLGALKRAHVRMFPHKHDPKKYGVWVNSVLLGLRGLEDKSYRFIVELVDEMSNILSLLGIKEAPHWTTLHKADRKSTRLNSSHSSISYAVFCLKKQ